MRAIVLWCFPPIDIIGLCILIITSKSGSENEEQIEYAKLLSNINNQKDLIFHTRLVYEDALTQIEFLKYDLLSRFSFTDLKDIFHKLYEIGEELKKKNKMLSDLEIELEEQYDKTREKVKRYAA